MAVASTTRAHPRSLPGWAELVGLYAHHVIRRKRHARVLGAVAFLVTFIAARIVTHVQLAAGASTDTGSGTGHIHHMVFGVVLLLIVVLLDHADALHTWRLVLAGIGAALVLDEFALLLNLADVYWKPEGRESIDAVIIFGAALAIVVATRDFGRSLWARLRR